MKKITLLIILFAFTFAHANDSGKNPHKTKPVTEKTEFNDRSATEADLEALDFTLDAIFKNVTFAAADKIDFINIYDASNQQIFSAKGSILKTDTLNISFLDKGTYYIEVVVGDTIGAQRIII